MSDIMNEETIKKDLVKIGKLEALLAKPIESEQEYDIVVEADGKAASFIKRVTDFFKPMKESAHATWKAICSRENESLDGAKKFREQSRKRMGQWFDKKEADRKREQAALDKRLAAEAKAERKEEVAALKESGDKDAASALKAMPLEVAQVRVKNAAEVEGVSFREEIEVEVLDINAVPDEFVTKALRLAAVKAAVKEGKVEIPGLKIRTIKTPVRK